MSPATAIEIGTLGGLGRARPRGRLDPLRGPGAVLAEIAGLDRRRRQPADAGDLRRRRSGPTWSPSASGGPRRRGDRGGGAVPAAHRAAVARPSSTPGSTCSSSAAPPSRRSTSRPRRSRSTSSSSSTSSTSRSIVGGCATYTAALHLMRTGAAGVLVGFGGGAAHTTRTVLGVAVPMATAVADVAAARAATTWTSPADATSTSSPTAAWGAAATSPRPIACGADAVMLGSPLARADRGARPRLALGLRGPPPGAAARRAGARGHGRLAAGDPAAARPRVADGIDEPRSARCAGRWRPPATPTSRSSSGSRWWSRPTARLTGPPGGRGRGRAPAPGIQPKVRSTARCQLSYSCGALLGVHGRQPLAGAVPVAAQPLAGPASSRRRARPRTPRRATPSRATIGPDHRHVRARRRWNCMSRLSARHPAVDPQRGQGAARSRRSSRRRPRGSASRSPRARRGPGGPW